MPLFEVTEYDRKIYEEELKDFLPEKMLDIHTHVWLDSLPTQSADEVEEKMRKGGFLGLKSYLDLAPSYLPASEIRIFDFFPRNT